MPTIAGAVVDKLAANGIQRIWGVPWRRPVRADQDDSPGEGHRVDAHPVRGQL